MEELPDDSGDGFVPGGGEVGTTPRVERLLETDDHDDESDDGVQELEVIQLDRNDAQNEADDSHEEAEQLEDGLEDVLV